VKLNQRIKLFITANAILLSNQIGNDNYILKSSGVGGDTSRVVMINLFKVSFKPTPQISENFGNNPTNSGG